MERNTSRVFVKRGLFLALGAIMIAGGCTKSAILELPFLRSAKDTGEVMFDSELGKNSTGSSTGLTVWHDSFETARQVSLESGKPILADFTGSDWCKYCVELKKDVLDTQEFKDWARDRFVLLELDYPRRKAQDPAIKRQNQELQNRYNITGFPTVLFLDSNGEVLGKLGYNKSPTAWIASAESQLTNSISR